MWKRHGWGQPYVTALMSRQPADLSVGGHTTAPTHDFSRGELVVCLDQAAGLVYKEGRNRPMLMGIPNRPCKQLRSRQHFNLGRTLF
jgi:hypothetical protein